MKKILDKKILYSVTALCCTLAILLSGCSSDHSADARDLLRTIPSDASAVAVINLHDLLEKAGCKIDGNEIKPSAEVNTAVATLSDPDARKLAALMVSNRLGVEPSVATIFAEGAVSYFCGYLSDPSSFKEAVEKEWSVKFVKTNGIEIAGNLAVKGNIFWARTDRREIDIDEVSRFNSISERQSILSLDAPAQLTTIEDDIAGWGNISGMLATSGIDFKQRSMTQMAIETIFSDPQDISFTIDFEKGKAEIEARILNSKGKTAKISLPTSKIDIETIRSLNGSADMVIAAALPQKLVKVIDKEISDKGVSMLAIMMKALTEVDGTAAVATDPKSDAMNGVVTTTGSNLTDLTNLISSNGATVKRDGKYLRFTKGTLSGALNLPETAESFKGAMMGAVVGQNDLSSAITSTAIMLVPDDGGLKIEVKAATNAPKENSLKTIVSHLKTPSRK